MKKVDRPIFVTGTGRSGMHPIMDLLAYHKDFSWPSQYNARHPNRFKISILNRILDLPLFHTNMKKDLAFLPYHHECWEMWESLFPGFVKPHRSLSPDDLLIHHIEKIRKSVYTIMRYHGKKRFIAEYSDWPRIAFFKKIFEDAKFVFVVRDGRAVAHSIVNTHWFPTVIDLVRKAIRNSDFENIVDFQKCSLLEIAALYWKILIQQSISELKLLDEEDYIVIKYESFVKNHYAVSKKCADFVGVDFFDSRYQKHLKSMNIINANVSKLRVPSWKNNVNEEQLASIEKIISPELKLLNYL